MRLRGAFHGTSFQIGHLKRRPQPCSRRVEAKLFTGIVQGTATIADLQQSKDITSFKIDFPDDAAVGVSIGASVALNGTCLTVTQAAANRLSFDVIAETLRRTNLGQLQQGSSVNFERSARVGDEIGGHNVSGHVHTTARIASASASGEEVRLEFQLEDAAWMKYILQKGFVAVDGCSLTVGEVTDTGFSVYLIPETLRVTVLGGKQQGDFVNIEVEAQTQAIVDTVERVVAAKLPQLLQAQQS